MSKSLLIIDSGSRGWLARILAAAFYTYTMYVLVQFFIRVEPEFAEWYYIRVLKLLAFLIFFLTVAVYFSLSKSFHFDLIKKEYRSYYSIGAFGFGKWEKHLEFKSVVVYLNSNDKYLVNIWDEKKNRITVGRYQSSEEANKFGNLLSKELNIKFQERKK